jgi:hypothetical protein
MAIQTSKHACDSMGHIADRLSLSSGAKSCTAGLPVCLWSAVMLLLLAAMLLLTRWADRAEVVLSNGTWPETTGR